MAEKAPLLSCNATRQELLEHLKSTTNSPELFAAFFRKEGDSTVCAACGKPIMSHPNGPAGHTSVPVPPPMYTPPPPQQQQASPTMGIPVTPLKNDNHRIHYKTNGTGAGFFSMLGGCWHLLRIAHFLWLWGGFLMIWVELGMGNHYATTPAPQFYEGSNNNNNSDGMTPAGLAAIQFAVMFVLQAPLFCRSRGYWLASRPANPEGFDSFNTSVPASRCDVEWDIVNSHVRSSVVGGTDYYGNTTITTVHQTIQTHSHSGGFPYQNCLDFGSDVIGPYDGKLFYVIQPQRELWFANSATQVAYETALARFMVINRRDNQTSLDEDYSLTSAPGGLSTIRMPEGAKIRKYYWLACLLGCGYLYDWHVSKKIQHLYPIIRKGISVV